MTDKSLLHRQIHPVFVQEGRVTSQAFSPTPKDKKRLSVYDGDRISAENAWKHFTEVLKHSSIGVLAVTVGECIQLNLPVSSDPNPFPEHTVIDFQAVATSGQMRKLAKILTKAANGRGWLFRS